ncbi:MAG TPA: hypothetical protein VGE74_07305 [Gemmata sp.]
MVTLYVSGEKVSTLADAPRLIAEFLTKNRPVEFRNEGGTVLGTFLPRQKEPPPDEPDWVKAVTPEETARRMAGPFLTFEEIRKQWSEG